MSRHRAFSAAVAVAAFAAAAAAQPNAEFAHERQVLVAGAGPQRLAVHDVLLAVGAPFLVVKRGETAFAERGLSDLRLFASAGRPVPSLFVPPATGEPEWVTGEMLGIAATKTTSGFEADFGAARPIDMIRVSVVPAPYLRRLRLEGGGDRARWTLLAAEGTLFDLPDEGLAQNTVSFTPGAYRYVRVVWNDANSGRPPARTAGAARIRDIFRRRRRLRRH